jgi:purine nucleoside permease
MSSIFQGLVSRCLFVGTFAGLLYSQTAAPAPPTQVKVVVVTMFERGEDTGDTPGEFQLWVERGI